jgi:hypothetical protein
MPDIACRDEVKEQQDTVKQQRGAVQEQHQANQELMKMLSVL